MHNGTTYDWSQFSSAAAVIEQIGNNLRGRLDLKPVAMCAATLESFGRDMRTFEQLDSDVRARLRYAGGQIGRSYRCDRHLHQLVREIIADMKKPANVVRTRRDRLAQFCREVANYRN